MEFDDEANIFDATVANNITGAIALGNSSAVVDIDTSNDDARSNPVPIDQISGTVYINPADGIDDIQLTIQDMVILDKNTGAANVEVEPLSYTVDVL
jgi:hypothetical protein